MTQVVTQTVTPTITVTIPPAPEVTLVDQEVGVDHTTTTYSVTQITNPPAQITVSELSVFGYPPLAIFTYTANHTLSPDDDIALFDCTGGALTAFLPDASLYPGMWLTIKKIDSTGNAVTIDGFFSQTVEGAATIQLVAQDESLDVFSDGTNFRVR